MNEGYIGFEIARSYARPADRKNNCLAVNLEALGVASMDDVNDALIAADITNADGVSMMPSEGTELVINGNIVSLGALQFSFSEPNVTALCRANIDDHQGLLIPVKLNELEPDNDDMHFIELAGYVATDGNVEKVLVIDSLVSGSDNMVEAQILGERLARTLDHYGALYSYSVAVKYAGDPT